MNQQFSEPDLGSFEGQVRFIQKLKGANATLLLCFLIYGRSFTQKQLYQFAPYTDKTIKKALNTLHEMGLIEFGEDHRWSLNAGFTPISNAVAFQLAEEQKQKLGSEAFGRPSHEPKSFNLEAFLKRVGVHQTILKRLILRPDLLAEPVVTQAWYWFYLTQDWARNPVGLMVGSITDGGDPPAAFLALARLWPNIHPEDRSGMREMAWFAASPVQINQIFREIYPSLTPQVCAAYLALHKSASEELDYGEECI